VHNACCRNDWTATLQRESAALVIDDPSLVGSSEQTTTGASNSSPESQTRTLHPIYQPRGKHAFSEVRGTKLLMHYRYFYF
jgi:hypothetical protein